MIYTCVASERTERGATSWDGANKSTGATSGSTSNKWNNLLFSADDSNSLFGGSTTVQPLAILSQYLIKY